jgi:hypothetical protein
MGWCRRTTPSLSGVPLGTFSTIQALLEPGQHLLFHPAHSAHSKPYPLGELAGGFQAGGVLGEYKTNSRTCRFDSILITITPMWEASRCLG